MNITGVHKCRCRFLFGLTANHNALLLRSAVGTFAPFFRGKRNVTVSLFDFAVGCPSRGPVLTVSRSLGFDSFQSVQVGQRGDKNKNAADGGGYNNQ